MTWDRAEAVAALVDVLADAVPNQVFDRMPETVNPTCLVVGRPASVTYSTEAFGIDLATLPVTVVGGIETEEAVDALKGQARAAVEAAPTLGGAVQNATPTEERNWRNYTGAGGIQLLTVDLILEIRM